MIPSFQFLPDAASKAATEVDDLAFSLLAICVLFSVGIFTALFWFTIRYWHSHNTDRQSHPSRLRHWIVELTWSLGPLTILIAMFVWGAAVFVRAHRPPENPLEVNVVAKQWMWKVAHPSGRREINSLHVPTGRPVRLTMISEDVIHSFFVPAFRTKQDVLPGRYSTFWFEATQPGTYQLFCAEYCGTSHSQMVGKVVVQSPQDYADWTAAETTQTQAQRGRQHLKTFGCLKCHAKVAGVQTGPSLSGLIGRTVPLAGGGSTTVDASYIRQSILEPAAQVHAGFKPDMPSFAGQIKPEEVMEIVAYLKSSLPPVEQF